MFTFFDTFAASIYDRDRFNTLIGLVFLAIVLISPDGLTGLLQRLRQRGRRSPESLSAEAPASAAAPPGNSPAPLSSP